MNAAMTPRKHRAGWTRRGFLAGGAKGLAGAACAAPWLRGAPLPGKLPPNERISVGLIGIGMMGSGHLRRLANDPKCEVRAVCDVDRVRRETAQTAADAIAARKTRSGERRSCKAHADFRELLARDDIDAVLIAAPDHWHAALAIAAARSGKDAYLEKPVSLTVEEGRRIVETVQLYKRVFQTGTQYRSIPAIRKVCEFVRRGGLGKIKSVFTQLFPLGDWISQPRCRPYARALDPSRCGALYTPVDFALPEEPVPEGLDWEMWVGPAPWRPYNRLYHVNPKPGVVPWSFDWAFGAASNTWFLSHAADVIQYALGMERSGPVEIIHPDSGRFPTLTLRYANGTLLHFIRDWNQVKKLYGAVPPKARLAGMFGGVFVGERGWLTSMTNGGPIEGEPPELFQKMGLQNREVNAGRNNHHDNWLRCIRARGKPSASEELGHRAACLGHLINIALWTGKSLRWDPEKERFSNCAAANRLLSRPTRAPWHL